MVQDAVALYFNLRSKIDSAENGNKALIYWDERAGIKYRAPHVDTIINCAKTLKEEHIPFGVITKKKIKELSKYKVLILPNISVLDENEIEEIKKYVINGGNLYLSGELGCTLLSDICGLEYAGVTEENAVYMCPTEDGQELIAGATMKYPLEINTGKHIKAKLTDKDIKIISTITLPYTDPGDPSIFASIHTNPPGINTGYPSCIYRLYGKGSVIWVSCPIETINKNLHRDTFINLIGKLMNNSFSFYSDAPYPVEILIFNQYYNKKYLINLINEQEVQPFIPVFDFNIKLNTEGRKIKRVFSQTDKKPLKFFIEDNFTVVNIPRLDLFNMIFVEYG